MGFTACADCRKAPYATRTRAAAGGAARTFTVYHIAHRNSYGYALYWSHAATYNKAVVPPPPLVTKDVRAGSGRVAQTSHESDNTRQTSAGSRHKRESRRIRRPPRNVGVVQEVDDHPKIDQGALPTHTQAHGTCHAHAHAHATCTIGRCAAAA